MPFDDARSRRLAELRSRLAGHPIAYAFWHGAMRRTLPTVLVIGGVNLWRGNEVTLPALLVVWLPFGLVWGFYRRSCDRSEFVKLDAQERFRQSAHSVAT